MIISICGPGGSGKSTVAKIVAEKLGYKRYYIGGIRRKVAKEKGMTLEEYNAHGEDDPSTDHEVDEYQEKLGKEEDNFVIEGRTSFYFIPHSFKIYIDVDPRVGAERVFSDLKKNPDRNEKMFRTVEETMKDLEERQASDTRRYMKYYGFDCYDKKHYDFVVDTTHRTVDEVVDRVMAEIEKRL